eukprot:4975415-Amphidinium_carterae.1
MEHLCPSETLEAVWLVAFSAIGSAHLRWIPSKEADVPSSHPLVRVEDHGHLYLGSVPELDMAAWYPH